MTNPVSTYQNEAPETPSSFPPQHQDVQPGISSLMRPIPIVDNPHYKAAGKLQSKVALISGGDSGIGLAAAIAMAKEGADIAIAYLNEHDDATKAKEMIVSFGQKCIIFAEDLRKPEHNTKIVEQVIKEFKRLDIVVNNLAIHTPKQKLEEITPQQLNDTFAANIFSYIYLTQAALPHLKAGASIINTTSITAFRGSPTLIDYASTKGAIVSFTRSLAQTVAAQGIRVNAIAPGPVWTPLIPSSFDADKVSAFGQDVPLGRCSQPFEMAPSYVFLACDDSAYMTGQVLHLNGGAYCG